MRRTHSETFDSQGNIVIDRERDKNRAVLHQIKNMTLTKVLKNSEPIQKVSVFRKLAGNLKNSIVPSRRTKCLICDMDVDPTLLLSLSACPHVFCESCATAYLNYKINAYEEIKCPMENCMKPLDKRSIAFQGLAIEMKNKYQKLERFELIKKNPKIKLCTQKDCEGVVDTNDSPAICIQCKTLYCPLCMYAKHDGSCNNFQIEFLQDNFKYRQCSQCKNVIEKNLGCNHITCRCGHQFCYVCGGDWATDPCRFGPPAPPPPPPPPATCGQATCRTLLKIFLLPLWAIFGIIIVAIPVLFYILMMMLLSFIGGPCEFAMNTLDTNNGCCAIFLCIIFPLLYLAGVPVFFYGQCGEIGDCFRRSFECYVSTLNSIWNW